MKTAVVSHLYPNRRYPANGTFVRDLFLQLNRRIQTDMLVPTVRSLPFTSRWRAAHEPFLEEDEAHRLRYLSIPRRHLPQLIRHNLSAAVTAHLDDHSYDLIHVNWLYPDGLSIPAIKRRNIPVVLTIHGSDWYKTRGRASLRKVLHTSLQQADNILTVGNTLKNDILSTYPELREKTHVIHNAVDFSVFRIPDSREQALAALGWEPDRRHLLCVANINPEKGVDVLLDAFQHITNRNTILHIIGNNPGDSYAQSVIAKIAQQQQVILHPPVTHEEIATYYQACDMLVLPSRKEGFGLSLAEAIACGKPVVSTKSGGPEDIVTSANGYLVDVEAPEQLADRIEMILSREFPHGPDEIRQSIRDRFRSDIIIGDIIKYYESLLT